MGRPCTSGNLPRAASGSDDSARRGGGESGTRFQGNLVRSAPFLVFDLGDPRLYHFLDKRSRQRLVRGELDGPFGCGEALEFVLECLNHRGSREQTAMVRERGEPHQHSFVLERRNPIADGLGSLPRHSGPNRGAKLVQGAAGRFRDTSNIFADVFRSASAFPGRTAIARFHFFHAGNSRRTSASSPCSAGPPPAARILWLTITGPSFPVFYKCCIY